ncbi:MAG: ABC transporter permease [Bacteroidota bacterium]
MLKNYFLTSFRSLRKNTFFLLVNILGISVAVAICVVGYFNFYFNYSFNDYFKNADTVYKINGLRVGNSSVGSSPISLARYLSDKGYESAKVDFQMFQIKNVTDGNQRLFREKVAFADQDLPGLLQFKNQNGDPISFKKNEVILTEQTSIRLFGETTTTGETVRIMGNDGKYQTFLVADVLEKLPQNLSFQFSILLPFDNYKELTGFDSNQWSHRISGTFIQLQSTELERALTDLNESLTYQDEFFDEVHIDEYRLDNLKVWPKIESKLFQRSFRGHLHPASVLGTVSSAIAILLLACFNFVNTSIAVAGRRLKEIGLRKVLGGSKKQVVLQFMMENGLLIFTGLCLSFMVLSALIPSYNALYEFEVIELQHVPWKTFLMLGLGILILVTLLSGAYPAFYLSGLSSLSIFRNKVILSGNNVLSKILLSVQLTLCIYNLFSLFIFIENSIYQEELDRGYAIQSTINVPLSTSEQYDLLSNELEKHPDIAFTSSTHQLIGFGIRHESLVFEGVDIYPQRMHVGPSYLQDLGVTLAKGSWFTKTNADTHSEVLVNQLFEKQAGRDLLHQTLSFAGRQMKVIGVVEDFNTGSIILDNKKEPLVITLGTKDEHKYLVARSNTLSDMELNILMEKTWYQLFPDELFLGFQQEKVLKPIRTTNKITISINAFIAFVSVLISIMGLYSLVSLIAIRRKKEFGIRKVLGSSELSIAFQLWKEFRYVIVIAALVAILSGNYIISLLLDIIFAYHIDISWQHAIYPVIFMIIVVALSIGVKIWKVVTVNPTEQLRTE